MKYTGLFLGAAVLIAAPATGARAATAAQTARAEQLVQTLKRDSCWTNRLEAARLLGEMGPAARRAASDLFIARVTDFDHQVRSEAGRALALVGMDETEAAEGLPYAVALLGDWYSGKRLDTALAIGGIGGFGRPAAAELLVMSVRDRDKDVRAAADWAFSETGVDQEQADRALPSLIGTLSGDGDSGARVRAAVKMGELGIYARGAVKPLRTAKASDPDPQVRTAAAEALFLIKEACDAGWNYPGHGPDSHSGSHDW